MHHILLCLAIKPTLCSRSGLVLLKDFSTVMAQSLLKHFVSLQGCTNGCWRGMEYQAPLCCSACIGQKP